MWRADSGRPLSIRAVSVIARAKVNLSLRVVCRREDGYHELDTIMQTVELTDQIAMGWGREQDRVSIEWAPGCGGTLPESPDLVAKAIELFRSVVNIDPLDVRVTKRIPIGSGLGGGSADAAAALMGANAIAGGPVAADDLTKLAESLGADVVFCMAGGTARATGKGEVLTPIETGGALWWVLGISKQVLATSEVFERYDRIFPAPAPLDDGMVEALRTGQWAQVATMLGNDLCEAAAQIFHDLDRLTDAMEAAGALGAVMSGSGSAIAGLCLNQAHAREVARGAAMSFDRVEVVTSAPRGAEVTRIT